MATPTKLIRPSDDVLGVLMRSDIEETPTGSGQTVLRIKEQLDRKLYEDVNKVLAEFGGKWDRKAKGHLFPAHSDPREKLTALVDDGEIRLDKLDFFPTPDEIGDRMVGLLQVNDREHSILEPSAGDGALCRALQRTGVPSLCIHVCESDPQKRQLLAAAHYNVVLTSDFLTHIAPGYDRIIMNPPFSGQRDIEHVTHAWNLLAPGGRLVSVMAEGVFFREDKKSRAFRELLDAHGYSIELPAGAFKESGTGVKTRLVVLDRATER